MKWVSIPPELARRLTGYGFDAEVRAYVAGARNRWWAFCEETVNKMPNLLRFALRPTFTCYATKTGAPTYLVAS
jgi:hypothetical protein